MRPYAAFALALTLAAGTAQAAAAPQGVWRTASGNVDVEIGPCGQALCGTVVRVLANRSMAAGGRQAAVPPPRTGLRLITDLRAARPGLWRGRLYNRENGRTYDCLIEPLADGTLKVRGYVLIPLVGKDQIWRRAAAG